MKPIVFTFGRMNSPTYGHKKLIDKVVSVAKANNADHRIYLSHSHDSTKNPLPYNKKLEFVRKLFPYANIVDDSKAKTAFHIAKILSDEGYKDVTMVVGDDRVHEFNLLLSKYVKSSKDPGYDPRKHYDFDRFKVVSAGKRNPNASGVEGASGTKMREFVKKDDISSFIRATPTNDSKLARLIFQTVKRNLRENMQPDIDIDTIEEELKVYELDREFVTEGLNDPGIFKAVFLAGGPGSGKDFILHKIIKGSGLVEINSDIAFEMLMHKNKLDLRMQDIMDRKRDEVRNRAKALTKEKNRLAVEGRLGMIINGTGGDRTKILKIKNELENLGYDTMMVFVYTSNEVSKERNIARGRAGGREVPEAIRKQKWDEAQENVYYYEQLFGRNFFAVDNSTDLRYVDKTTKSQIEKNFNTMHRAVRAFVSSKPKSPEARKWIQSELDRRKISNFSPAKSHRFGSRNESLNERWSDVKDFEVIKSLTRPFTKHKTQRDMTVALRDYRKAVDSPEYKGKTFQYIADVIAKTYGFKNREFFEYLKKAGKKGILSPKYISEDRDLILQLKKAYDDIEKIDPRSEMYKRLTGILDVLASKDPKTLKKIADANIRWVSSLARNRVKK